MFYVDGTAVAQTCEARSLGCNAGPMEEQRRIGGSRGCGLDTYSSCNTCQCLLKDLPPQSSQALVNIFFTIYIHIISLFTNFCRGWTAMHNSLHHYCLTFGFQEWCRKNARHKFVSSPGGQGTEQRASITSQHTPPATAIGLLLLLALSSLKVENLSCRVVLPESLWAARCWLLGNVSTPIFFF